MSVAMAADPRTAAITLEAALRLQHSAITQQLPGALEDEETRSIRIRGTHGGSYVQWQLAWRALRRTVRQLFQTGTHCSSRSV